MKTHVVMIIANSPNPAYFTWFAKLNMKENDFKFTYIYLNTKEPELTEKLKQYNVTSYWFPFDYTKSKYLQYFKLLIKFFFLFRKIKPDVVQTNLFDDSLVGMLAARLAGVKRRIMTKQDTGFHINYCPQYIKFDKFNNRNATHVLPVSIESLELIRKYEQPDEEKIHVVHHAVDQDMMSHYSADDIKTLKDTYNLHGKKVLGTVSRYVTSKGYKHIIEATGILKKKFPDIIFLAAGYGPERDMLEDMIKEFGVEQNFILTGKINFELIPSFYKCLDVYVHAANYEPFGFVFAEAMFNKTPIVSTKVGAVRDVLTHKESCYFTGFNNAADIAEGINYLLENREASERMALNAYTIAKEKFSKEIMWNNYKKLFLG